MDKKKLTVSVIVPVYMVNDYLDRCIKSLVNQRYKSLEIILVDDGSSDDCAIKCNQWAQTDSRITVIHKTNGGLSDARNYGIKLASGEYIAFIDSDDYVSGDFIEVLLSTALEHNSDIVECNVAKFYENGEHEEYQDDFTVKDYNASEGLSALINENSFHQHVWNKLYKREAGKDILFEVGKLNEDEFWTYQVFGQAERVTKIKHTMYFYFQRGSSIMGQTYNLRRLDALEGKWNRQKYIEEFFPELALQAKLDFFGSCIYALQCVIEYMSGVEKRQAVAVIRHYKKICRLSFKDIVNVCDSARKYYYLAKLNIYLCCKLRVMRGVN